MRSQPILALSRLQAAKRYMKNPQGCGAGIGVIVARGYSRVETTIISFCLIPLFHFQRLGLHLEDFLKGIYYEYA